MAREPLLLIPGLTCTRALWLAQIEGLADVADMTVADHTRHDTMAAIAAGILQSAPARFALAGLSMGGYIAFEIMRQAPERVSRLALLDTLATPDAPERAVERRRQVGVAKADGMRKGAEAFARLMLHPSRHGEHDLFERVVGMAMDTGAEVFARQQEAIISRTDSRPTLATISCPTLVLVGRQDLLTPLAAHEVIHAGIAGSRLVIVEDCGHLPTMERPALVNAALRDWLARTT